METIIAQLYNKVYIIIVLFLTMSVLKKYYVTNSNCIKENTVDYSNARTLTILMILFIGFRPISIVFMDMLDYSTAMLDHRYENVDYSYNYVFTPMMGFLSSIGAAPRIPIVLLAFINLFVSYIAIRKFFPQNTYLAYLVFLGCFSTFMYATNGLKAGCAAAWLLCAAAYRDNLKISLPLLLVSLGFHHSMQVMVVAYVLSFFYRNSKHYICGWLACLLISFLHIQYFQLLFAGFTDEHGADYLTISEDSDFFVGSGFRYDFVLYSALPIVIGWYYIVKKKNIDSFYSFVLNMYIVGNSAWLLCMYANYSYRFAYLSWSLFPALILYPFLRIEKNYNGNKRKYFKWIVLLNVLFTLFLYFVKY